MKTNKEKYLISARAVAMAIASSLPRIIPKWGEERLKVKELSQ